MKNSVKAALAAVAGGTLLLGGAGTLAYWSDSEDVDSGSLTSGSLTLVETTCPDWTLNGSGLLGSKLLAPGDDASRTCTYTLTAQGSTLTADFDVAVPGVATDVKELLGEMTLTQAFSINGGSYTNHALTPGTAVDIVPGTYTVTAKYDIDFPLGSAVDNGSQADTATVPAVTMTVTQDH